jgi:hypothetical protein
MNDAVYKTQKKRVGDFLTKWQGPMGLRMVKVNVTWDRSYDGDGAAARTTMNRWQYKEFDITFYLPRFIDLSDDEAESVVVHELSHCLMAPISMNMTGVDDDNDYRRQLMELNTSQVSDALEWVYQAGRDSVKVKTKHKEHDSDTGTTPTEPGPTNPDPAT